LDVKIRSWIWAFAWRSAQARDVLKLVIGHGLILTLIGTANSVAGALALTRVMRSRLYTVRVTDPAVFIFAPVVLLAVTVFACYLRAQRTTKVDPLVALRYE